MRSHVQNLQMLRTAGLRRQIKLLSSIFLALLAIVRSIDLVEFVPQAITQAFLPPCPFAAAGHRAVGRCLHGPGALVPTARPHGPGSPATRSGGAAVSKALMPFEDQDEIGYRVSDPW